MSAASVASDILKRFSSLGLRRQTLAFGARSEAPELLLDRLDLALTRASRSGRFVAVLAIRIDQLPNLDHRHGTRSIDALCRHLASRLRVALRPTDTVGRHSADTFLVVCDDLASDPEVLAIISRVRRTLSEPFRIGGFELIIEPTIGVALAIDRQRPADMVVHDALASLSDRLGATDTAHPQLRRDHDRTRNGLDRALAAALDNGQLSVSYQPIVDLDAGTVVGAEALVRWPGGPLETVEQLIAAAESSGLIVRLGRWVLHRACEQLSEWHHNPALSGRGLRMNVNLSGRQLAHPSLIDDIISIVTETKIDPTSITLEITESLLVSDMDATVAVLDALKSLGFGLSVDDFGTGYSSFTYLNRFPIDALKVDGSFIAGLGIDDERTAIVESVVELAAKLAITATAEGVESEVQLQLLRAMSCDLVQGYLLAEPLDPTAMTALLLENPRY